MSKEQDAKSRLIERARTTEGLDLYYLDSGAFRQDLAEALGFDSWPELVGLKLPAERVPAPVGPEPCLHKRIEMSRYTIMCLDCGDVLPPARVNR